MGFSLIPFYWLVNTSLKKGASLSQGELFPSQPTLENYLVVFQNPEFLLALRNSVIIAVVTTTVALVFASFAAYALAIAAAGALLHYAVERPFLRLRTRLARAGSRRPAETQAASA